MLADHNLYCYANAGCFAWVVIPPAQQPDFFATLADRHAAALRALDDGRLDLAQPAAGCEMDGLEVALVYPCRRIATPVRLTTDAAGFRMETGELLPGVTLKTPWFDADAWLEAAAAGQTCFLPAPAAPRLTARAAVALARLYEPTVALARAA